MSGTILQQRKAIHSSELMSGLAEASTARLLHAAGLALVDDRLQCRKYPELFCFA